jgi:hypothetical protein
LGALVKLDNYYNILGSFLWQVKIKRFYSYSNSKNGQLISYINYAETQNFSPVVVNVQTCCKKKIKKGEVDKKRHRHHQLFSSFQHGSCGVLSLMYYKPGTGNCTNFTRKSQRILNLSKTYGVGPSSQQVWK